MEQVSSDERVPAIYETAEPGTTKKGLKAPERVSLSVADAEKLDRWLSLARDASLGFLSLSRSDLVTFLIGEHRDALSPSEIKRLRVLHYDPLKHMQWIMPQIKAALAVGDHARVARLQSELRSVELSKTPDAIPGRSVVVNSEGDKPNVKVKKRGTKHDQTESVTDSENAPCIDEMAKN